MSEKPFDFTTTLQELDAGVFVAKLTKAIKEVTLGTVEHNKKGKVTISLEFKRIGESNQIMLSHKLSYSQPTERGSRGEDNETSTALYVAGNGAITIMPDTQQGLFTTED